MVFQSGFEIDLIKKISENITLPVIAASGAGTVDHIISVCQQTKCDAVAIGSMLHYENDSIQNIKLAMQSKGIEVRI